MCSCVCVSWADVCARVWVPLEVRGVGSLLSWATGSCELSDVVRSSSRAVLSLNHRLLSNPNSYNGKPRVEPYAYFVSGGTDCVSNCHDIYIPISHPQGFQLLHILANIGATFF